MLEFCTGRTVKHSTKLFYWISCNIFLIAKVNEGWWGIGKGLTLVWEEYGFMDGRVFESGRKLSCKNCVTAPIAVIKTLIFNGKRCNSRGTFGGGKLMKIFNLWCILLEPFYPQLRGKKSRAALFGYQK